MRIDAVLVSCKLSKSSSSSESSGVLFNKNLVLVTGAVLIPFLNEEENKEWMTSFVKSSTFSLKTNKHINKVLFGVFEEADENKETNEVDGTKLLFRENKVAWVWKCPLVTHSLENLFYNWTMAHVTNNKDQITRSSFKDQFTGDINLSKELMSIFIILKLKGEGEQEQMKEDEEIHELFSIMPCLQEPNRGEEVELISTPFGNRLFLNSLSRGIISNVIGSDRCIILTDARTTSGCEGGPIFAVKVSRDKKKEKGKLLGLITCPLTWWRGEWVGLSIGVSLLPILRNLLLTEVNYTDQVSSNTSANNSSSEWHTQNIDKTVVLVRSEDTWGSGVVLNAGSRIVITCSHVLKNNKNVTVFYKNQHFSTDIIFQSRNEVAYDLAIIQVHDDIFEKEMQVAEKPAVIGETIFAAGFPFFSERDQFNLQPSLVRGCVARANSFMIQTTCCIQSGFSGGPILRDGKLLGIIISNTKDNSSGALYPHINFAIPSCIFQKPIQGYLKTKNQKCLTILEIPNSKIQSLWTLQCSKL